MAYSVNGKIHTDHPLMDEIVSCCKTIFDGIVIKNDVLAISYETDESIAASEEYINVVEDKFSFATFPFTKDMLEAYTKNGVRVFTDEQVKNILEDRYVVPTAIRSDLLAFSKKYYIDNYYELNNYYRSLNGLPPNRSDVFNIRRERANEYYEIFVYPEDFPIEYDTSHIEFTDEDNDDPKGKGTCVYIHKLSNDDISVLEQSGFITNLIENYQGFNYSYLKYLGYKSIDIYKARKAIKWEILYIPPVEQLVQQRFEELYNINRAIYLKRTYQDAMSLGSNHYDESLILLLLCQTFNDMIVDVPEWYIRRDIFDIRSVQYFLESFGVEFFDVIPLKYQIAIVKNLNKLIKYKSSTRNINDIIDLFNLEGTYAYKYFLYKKKINDSTDENPENYELEFVKAKQGDAFDKYINNNIYRYKYDDLTLYDKFWDGVYREWKLEDRTFKEKLHKEIEDLHSDNADYTITGTKYMSIDYEVNMDKYQYQVEYFYSFLLNSEIDTDDVKIVVPSISTTVELKISDIFVMMYLLSFAYDGVSDNVSEIKDGNKTIFGRRPENNMEHQLEIHTPKVKYYEQLFTDDGDFDDYLKWNRVFGTYYPPVFFDTNQFNFGKILGATEVLGDNREFDYGDIFYNLDEQTGNDDYNETLPPPEEDFGYDFIDPDFDIGNSQFIEDDGLYNFNDYQNPPPEEDITRYDFMEQIDINPDEFFKQLFEPKHWEVKSYIENQDSIATSQGYNSFPIWADTNRDWIYRFLPEALKTKYDRVNGFNFALEPEDLDKLLEFIEHRNKTYNFDKGYTGYSYKPVYNLDGDIIYYEITYEYNEDIYNFDEYKEYIAPGMETDDPEYNEWLYTHEGYVSWTERVKELFLINNPRGPLGIAGFRIIKKLDTIKDLIDGYDINTVCYNDLKNRIINAQCRDENVVLRYIFEQLFTRQFDYKFYQVDGEDVDYMNLILRDRNYFLYNYYKTLVSETNRKTRQNNIRTIMNDIITTLEYYLRGENFEFIYSSFSITSFSSLLYYIYLMINFFKSWKVYFLDPAVTIRTDNRLDSGSNYGTGIDNISEFKINYWNEDKDFKRDNIDLNLTIEHKDLGSTAQDRYKEVLDIYGRYDPDPTSDHDYDGYTPEKDEDETRHNIKREKDVNGGVVDGSLNIPYNMINGGKAYGKLVDIWDLDGSTPEEHIIVADADGGRPYNKEDYYKRSIDNLYQINAGNPGTNLFWTNTLHTRVINRQIENETLISDKEANLLINTDDGLYIQQAWAAWTDFEYYKNISDSAYSYINYVMDVLYDDLVIITDENALQAEIDRLINQDLANMRRVVYFANNIDREKANYKGYIDNSVRSLEVEFADFSPYSWENFNETDE